MNAAHREDGAAGREIARSLVAALRAALEPGAPVRARAIARDIAQVLGLDGLDALLAELGRPHAVPADYAHVAARIARACDAAEAEGSPAPFRDADGELAAHARALAETEWTDEGPASAPVYAAAEVLAGLPLDPNPDLARARLAAPVASSLRAALEWIGADEALLVQSSVQDSALTLTCPASHDGGLGPAGAVLAAVEGSLAPEDGGRWSLRVPLHVERPSFLLLRVGHVPVALPWHAVARLRMLPAADWPRQAEPVLEPLAPPQAAEDERPGALVALGLTRAWLVADRIVWRIAMAPEDVEERGPFGASTRAVRLEGGERYWVLEAAWLLRNAAPIAVAPPAPRPRSAAPAAFVDPAPRFEPPAAPETAAPAPGPRIAAAAPAAAPAAPEPSHLADAVAAAIERLREERDHARAAAAPAPAPSPSRELPRPGGAPPAFVDVQLTVLRPEDVVPLGVAPHAPAGGGTAAPAPPAAPAPARPVAPAPEAPPAAPAPQAAARPERPAHAAALPGRRALVADDSLVARIFLARLLERRGYHVELVGDGQSLWEELARGPWSLVCADVTMPDAHGRAHLERIVAFRDACREPFRLVALTRDAAEERDAALAGAALCLRKPFDPGALDDLLHA